MKKCRLLSMLLVLLLVMQGFSAVSAAEETQNSLYYDREAQAVVDYLLGDGFFGGELVTRGEFAAALSGVFALSNAGGMEFSYSDVAETTPYAAEIYNLLNAGIISPAESFEPDSPVQYNQAVKMVVCAIGYGNVGEYYGGYPGGYIKAASNLKLTKYVDYSDNGMTTDDVCQLLFNLVSSTVAGTAVYEDYIQYEHTGKSYLETIHNLCLAEGIVTGTQYNSYRSNSPVSDRGIIEIDGDSYWSQVGTPDMLGLKVCAYYDKDTKNIKIIVPMENEEVIFDGSDIASLTSNQVKYYNAADKAVTCRTNGAVVVYNGRAVTSFGLVSLTGDNSTFRLVDNDGDNVYEYMFVYDYQYLYVNQVDIRNKTISDYNGSVYLFDGDAEDTSMFLVSPDGEEIELADIKSGSLLAVAKSTDGAVAYITQCGETVAGTITAISNDDDEIVIDGNTYDISKYANDNYKSNLVVGSTGSFIIGQRNDVVAVNAGSDAMEYGYLIDSIISSGLSKEVSLKIYTKEGEIKIFPASEVYFDDNATASKENSILTMLSSGGEVEPQLIRYKTDREGYIVNIDLADTDFVFGDDITCEEDALRKYSFTDASGSAVTSFNYRSGGRTCAHYFNVDGTVIFSVPNDSEVKSAEEKEFTVTGYESLISNKNYSFEAYDLSESGTAGAVVLKGDAISDRGSYVVEKAIRGLTPDGGSGNILYVYGSQKYETYYLDDSDASALGKTLCGGDIIEISADSDNVITDIIVVFDASGTVPAPNTAVPADIRFETPTNKGYYYGSLYSKDGTYGYISRAADGQGGYSYSFDKLMNLKLQTANMVVINQKRNEVRPITISELRDYKSFGGDNHYIVAYMNYQSPLAVYVYER
ncbi:MAG: S-layer homology domain-containing protein [Clostridia bacterium]|nr:S-layer homology domain-containing protein [Clostridia bacterium]